MERANAAELFLFRYLASAQTKSVKRVFLVRFPPLTRFCFGTVVLIIPLPHTTILPTQNSLCHLRFTLQTTEPLPLPQTRSQTCRSLRVLRFRIRPYFSHRILEIARLSCAPFSYLLPKAYFPHSLNGFD